MYNKFRKHEMNIDFAVSSRMFLFLIRGFIYNQTYYNIAVTCTHSKMT